ncbi:MAG TPA: hypothetical protein VGX78_12360 [Pirellulales bacterium]|nr:hypothetical protein [Pirellulales bacterium]
MQLELEIVGDSAFRVKLDRLWRETKILTKAGSAADPTPINGSNV